jgi:hypothetical protein
LRTRNEYDGGFGAISSYPGSVELAGMRDTWMMHGVGIAGGVGVYAGGDAIVDFGVLGVWRNVKISVIEDVGGR